MHKMWNL